MEKFATLIGSAVLVLLLATAFGMIFSIPVMLIWNWLVTDIFGLRSINILEAWMLSLLSSMLFKANWKGATNDKK